MDVGCSNCYDTSNTDRPNSFLECDRLLATNGPPKQRYRPKRYLIVSDLAKQLWCEQQLLYGFSPEIYLSRALPDSKVDIDETDEQKATRRKGADIHLAREQDINKPVPVEIITREDDWAVRLLNLQFAVLSFHNGSKVAREVPIFGMPFGIDDVIYGIVDELQYDPDTHAIVISELKTRRSNFPPKKSQQDKDLYQVSLYAQLFNELVQGKVNKHLLNTHLQLDLDAEFSDGVRERLKESGSDALTLSQLFDIVLSQVQSLTCIEFTNLEYILQEDNSTILEVKLNYDPENIKAKVLNQVRWWKGERGTVGVDVEDCWKCSFCRFSELCEWRQKINPKVSESNLEGGSNGVSQNCESSKVMSEQVKLEGGSNGEPQNCESSKVTSEQVKLEGGSNGEP
ncbi:exonuclease V-like isoform X2 [Physella acuta]|uniref:exonuclease V-like isoform X2 n=1 Tax=Physella acuta TaxID=109671 RepID=UPI0027DE1D3D|nr:exonuclease V-like isoform X2 [Physella acuta]